MPLWVLFGQLLWEITLFFILRSGHTVHDALNYVALWAIKESFGLPYLLPLQRDWLGRRMDLLMVTVN